MNLPASAAALARTFLDASPDCLKIVDLAGALQFINRQGLCLMELGDGGPPIGADWASLWPAEGRERVRHAVADALATGSARFQGFCPTARGAPKWWDVLVTPIRDGDGEPQALLAVSREISELKEKQQALERALQVQEDVVANLSHELRTPLTGILGFTEVLLSRDGLDREAREHLGHIRTASESLLALLNDLLDLSRANADALALDEAPCDLDALAASVCRLAEPLGGAKPLRFAYEGSPELAGAWLADEHRVRQVLLNLVSNAVKFTDSGEIRVRLRRTGAFARFEVRDTGEGIPAEVLPRVFERFVQADSGPSRRRGGAGLGLAICRELTHKMGGEIGAESALGHGSLFWFTLPLRPAREAPPSRTAKDPSAAGVRGARVLVADDNPLNQRLLSVVLGGAGHEVVTAANGAEALRAAAAQQVDLVLMDIHMPVLDGLSAIRRMKASAGLAAIPVLAITANVLPEQVESYLAAGARGCIAKPFTPAAVLRAVADALAAEASVDADLRLAHGSGA